MDKYEYRVSLDEIDRLIEERHFKEAAAIADKIDWKNVRGTFTLCRISDLYKINRRYEDSLELLEIAYERKPSSRKIIYSLCELELKLDHYIHALQLYNAFINVAPRDPDRFLLQYKLYKKQDVNVFEQISVLEEFLRHDFREKYAYELATLYLKAGDELRCARQCDEIVAYFGDGRFVIRALELKQSLTPLTPQQEEQLAILRAGGSYVPPAPPAEENEPSEETAESAETEAVDQPQPETEGRAEDADEDRKPDAGTSGGEDVPEDSLETGNPEEYTDTLLSEVKMQETIANGMREIDDYDNVLAQETSGQLAMVMEEEPVEETQTEGQLNLEQIMSEWEKIRRNSEQQRLAEARRRVMEKSDAVKRELYGDDFSADSGDSGEAEDSEEIPAGAEDDPASGTTRSWDSEEVRKQLDE